MTAKPYFEVDAIKMRGVCDKDGHNVTLRLHKINDYLELVDVPVGTQMRLLWGYFDKDGNPIQLDPDAGAVEPARGAGECPDPRVPAPQHITGTGVDHAPDVAGGDPPAREVGAGTPASPLTKQAGRCCKDPVFWAFLRENDMLANDAKQAAIAVRLICGVDSRKCLVMGSIPGDKWDDLYSKYQAWRYVPDAA